MTKLTPIESEFATTEDAEAYDAWFRAEVEAAMASNEPDIPHDEAMARMQAIIDRRKKTDRRKTA
ncbi:stability determinant [Sphingomonas sp. VDB2]|uniref:type II toxin-antitoxin system RelB family antitoxin n=1 Tax=Sphingomonas sp. VDB2 TaxID=3228751 RepID=UPI003A811935